MKKLLSALFVAFILLTTMSYVFAQDGRFARTLQRLMERKQENSAAKDQDSDSTEVTIQSGGIPRTYHIHIPPSYNKSKPIPLVFAFHGGGGKGTGMEKLSKMDNQADAHGFVVLYPDAINKHWNDGRTDYPNKNNANDIGFVQDMLRKIESEMNIDTSRIYACGISNGGLFSERLACTVPNIFAAAASVAANLAADNSMIPSQPFSIMYILGTDDPLMPFRGGDIKIPFLGTRGKVLSGDETVSVWVKYNHCPPKPIISTYGEPGTKLSIQSKTYGPGINNSEVVYCTVQGGGHCWPGGKQYLGPRLIGYTSPINANEIICAFFSKHRL